MCKLSIKTIYSNKAMSLTLFVLILSMLMLSTISHASWLFYNKSEFRGRIVDDETKSPISGVVIVAMYYKSPIISGPAGGSSSIVHVKETLTNEEGEFYIPAYSTVIQPLSIEGTVEFIIYKPGYKSYPSYPIFPLKYIGPAKLFSNEIGTKLEVKRGDEIISVSSGTVELLKVRTRDERLKATPGTPGFISSSDLPLLYKAINEEQKRFGLKEVK